MELSQVTRISELEWWVAPREGMRVPAVIYATEALVRGMDDKVLAQLRNVASLPGIVRAAYCMPDAHWGYGFPIGGVAAFDPAHGGVVSAGGVGFDVSCGVRLLLTGLHREELEAKKVELADALFTRIPAGVGSTGRIALSDGELDQMLEGGARWAVRKGWGESADLDVTEERGRMAGADPSCVSQQAKDRQRHEMGTLGSGNHYLEVQHVVEVHDERLAQGFGLAPGDVVVSLHCGSRGLGHQIGTDYLRLMALEAHERKLELPDRDLAYAPLESPLGRRYLGAMRAAINCALANREILTHLVRGVFAGVLPEARLRLLYDVSHNTCKEETHEVDGVARRLFVHRKGATRAFGPGHAELPEALKALGQPVLIGGSMGTASYVLAGAAEGGAKSFSSACHGAGRSMSRHEATRRWKGSKVVRELEQRGILIRSPSLRGVAEEAPGAYKRIEEVVEAADRAGLARRVARLEPLVCLKG